LLAELTDVMLGGVAQDMWILFIGVGNNPALYGNRIFITGFTRAANCPKSEAIVNVS